MVCILFVLETLQFSWHPSLVRSDFLLQFVVCILLFLIRNAGRDKMYRLLQATIKLVVWILNDVMEADFPKHVAVRQKNLISTVAPSRFKSHLLSSASTALHRSLALVVASFASATLSERSRAPSMVSRTTQTSSAIAGPLSSAVSLV